MKEIINTNAIEKLQEPIKEQEVSAQPSNEEVIELLSRKVIEQNNHIEDLKLTLDRATQENSELRDELNKTIEQREILKERLERLEREREREEHKCSEVTAPCAHHGFYAPWGEKIREGYEALEGEKRFYTEQINGFRHACIEHPKKKPLFKREIRVCKASLRKIKKLMRVLVK